MTKRFILRLSLVAVAVLVGSLVFIFGIDRSGNGNNGYITELTVDKSDLTNTGRNPYFILEPGWQLTLVGGDERLEITVLSDTKLVDGVETRVVEERETKADKLVEISRNYFAISKRTEDVFYFGEDVDIYDATGSKVVSHDGSWLSGVSNAKFGLIMPGGPLVGDKYYQEIAPGVAQDRAKHVRFETVKTPAGTFDNCLRVEETSPLEKGKSVKYYAKDVGLIQDGSLKLTQSGLTK